MFLQESVGGCGNLGGCGCLGALRAESAGLYPYLMTSLSSDRQEVGGSQMREALAMAWVAADILVVADILDGSWAFFWLPSLCENMISDILWQCVGEHEHWAHV